VACHAEADMIAGQKLAFELLRMMVSGRDQSEPCEFVFLASALMSWVDGGGAKPYLLAQGDVDIVVARAPQLKDYIEVRRADVRES